MDLIDLALQIKDYEWIKELQKLNEVKPDTNKTNNTNTIYLYTTPALETITNKYVIKEYNGIRNLNLFSEYEISEKDIVLAEKEHYEKGEEVKYWQLNEGELIYVRGFLIGFMRCHIDYQNKLYNAPINYESLTTSYKSDLETEISSNQHIKNELKDKKWYQFWK